LEELEVSIVSWSLVKSSSETIRFDPEYFKKVHLADDLLIATAPERFLSFSDLTIKIDASAFYPSIEEYYGEGGLPFLRVSDVDTFIDFDGSIRIPSELCDRYHTLQCVDKGDIILTKGDSVARVGLVTQSAAVSRDLIFLNTSKLNESDLIFLYLYFQTDFFNRILLRSSSQTAQPHLTITLVRNLKVIACGDALKKQCATVVKQAFIQREYAINEFKRAETTLMQALGLEGWQPPEPLTYMRRASEAVLAGRLDAEYYAPAYDALLEHIKERGAIRLGDAVREHIRRGISPEYVEEGDLIVINSQHVGKTHVIINDNRKTLNSLVNNGNNQRNGIVSQGDVLLNSTGVVTIGRCQCLLDDVVAVVDNHVAIIRPTEIDPVYLAYFLNSLPGQMQTERGYTGSSGQIELRPDVIEDFTVWQAPHETQVTIRQLVESANNARRKASMLLERAKKAVEIAIEQNEDAALDYLTKRGINDA
jgi:restriction endonuclease S subunit